MVLKRSRRVSRNVIKLSLPPLSTSPFRVPRNRSRPSSSSSSMRRAMSSRQEKQIWGRRPATVRVTTPGIESRSPYPQLDVNRFVHAFSLNPSGRGSNGSSSNKGEQPRTLRDILASSNRRPSAVFGIGLGMEDYDVENKTKSSIGPAAEEIDVREDEVEDEGEGEGEDGDISAEEGLDVEEELAAEVAAAGMVELELPQRPLAFHMSDEMFLTARASATESPESYWSHKMYERVQDDGTIDKVKVHYCTDRDSMERVCKTYFSDEPILGFDLEWMLYATRRSGPRENVSLIQIASPSHIGLFHIALFPEDSNLAAPTFRKIMGNPRAGKVGVNVLADSTRLKNHLQIDSRGIFELSHLYRLVTYLPQNRFESINRKPVALAVQVEDQLGLPLFKGEAVRTSNWMKPLDEDQLLYSASDAYASLQLYHALEMKRMALKPRPVRPSYAELGLPIAYPKLDPPKETDQKADEKVGAEEHDDTDLLVDNMVARLDTLTISVETPSAPSLNNNGAISLSRPSRSKSQKPSPRATVTSSDPRVLAAELRMEQYRSSKDAPLVAKPSTLRAYYLWADDDSITPETIAGLLQVQASTVVSYIANAIMNENFPFSKERARRDLLPLIHPNIVKNSRKIGSFLRECRQPDEE